MRHTLILLVKTYQYLLSPFVGQHCRFYPTCSHYAVESLQQHGSVKGTWLALRRLLRCHPWAEGGIDLVPENTECSDCHHTQN